MFSPVTAQNLKHLIDISSTYTLLLRVGANRPKGDLVFPFPDYSKLIHVCITLEKIEYIFFNYVISIFLYHFSFFSFLENESNNCRNVSNDRNKMINNILSQISADTSSSAAAVPQQLLQIMPTTVLQTTSKVVITFLWLSGPNSGVVEILSL